MVKIEILELQDVSGCIIVKLSKQVIKLLVTKHAAQQQQQQQQRRQRRIRLVSDGVNHVFRLPDEILRIVASFWPSILLVCRTTQHAVLEHMGSVRPMAPLSVYSMSDTASDARTIAYAGRQCFRVFAASPSSHLPVILSPALKTCLCNKMEPCNCTSYRFETFHCFVSSKKVMRLAPVGSVLPTVRFPIAFFPTVLPRGMRIVRVFSMARPRDIYGEFLRFNPPTFINNVHGPHVVVYRPFEPVDFVVRVAVLSTKGVFFPNVRPVDPMTDEVHSSMEFRRVTWYDGKLCVHNVGNKSKQHLVQIWSFRERAVVQRVVGKRVWSKFRGRNKEKIKYAINVTDDDCRWGNYEIDSLKMSARAPDGEIRCVVVKDRVPVWS